MILVKAFSFLLLFTSSFALYVAPDHKSFDPDIDRFLGGHIYGVDILVKPDTPLLVNSLAATADRSRYWPAGRIPYVIDQTLSQTRIRKLKKAMQQFVGVTCVRYVQRTNESRYVHFVNQPNINCYTEVGMAPSSADPSGQPFNVGGPECKNSTSAFKHMLMHPLGFWHEEMRQDRDQNIDILYDNVKYGEEGSYLKFPLFGDIAYQTPYDYDSIMHTGSYHVSKEYGRLRTQQTKNGGFITSAYDKPGIDDIDIDRINRLYGC